MSDENTSLVLDLVEWIAARPRPYAEVMEAWRTSCPRLTIWEDALDGGFVVTEREDGAGTIVRVTPRGRDLLRRAGRLLEPTAAPDGASERETRTGPEPASRNHAGTPARSRNGGPEPAGRAGGSARGKSGPPGTAPRATP